MSSLSICFVTRNQEQTLPRALASVVGLADEVIVLDTGSTDDTVRVAREGGARTVAFSWDDDFSAACNAALDEARCEWFLLLNHDEEVEPIAASAFREHLGLNQVCAYQLRIQHIQKEGQGPPYMESTPVRMFRKQSGVRYVGRLHPHFVVPMTELAEWEGRVIALAKITLRHHAYLSVPTPDKLRWTLHLLERELADRPDQLHYRIEQGLTLLRLNDLRGHEVLGEAMTKVWAQRAATASPSPSVAQLLEYLLTTSQERLKCAAHREPVTELALRWFPRSPVLMWHIAQLRFGQGDFAGAAELLGRLHELGQTGEYDRSVPFDPAIMGEAALVNLAACQIRVGLLDPAEANLSLIRPGSPHARQAAGMRDLIERTRTK